MSPQDPSNPPDGRAGAVPLLGPRFQEDPGGLYEELRERFGPVAPVVLEGGVPAWLVLGYREMLDVVRDATLFTRDSRVWRDWRAGRVPPDWPLMPMVTYRNSILYSDGPEHLRRQSAIVHALHRVDQRRLRRFAEAAADDLISAIAPEGRADLLTQYAQPLPLLALGRMLGMPDAAGPELVASINGTFDGGGDALKAQMQFFLSMQRLVTEKQARPGGDLPSWMLGHDSRPTPEEVLEDLLVTVAAGHQSTANWIGNALRVLLTDRRFHASVAAGRRTVSEALDLVLWQDPPTQIFAGRWATRDTVLGGTRLQEGDFLVIGPAAANADPAVRPPDGELAGNRAHLAWSAGPHGCPMPAQDLARMLALIAVETVLDRLPGVQLAVPAERLAWRPSPWMRGLAELPVTFPAIRPR